MKNKVIGVTTDDGSTWEENGCTRFRYNPARGEGDRHFVDIFYKERPSLTPKTLRVFNIVEIEFEGHLDEE